MLWATQLNLVLSTNVRRHVSTCTYQSWQGKDWSTSGKYLSIQAVEETLGDLLRLEQYRHCFDDDAAAAALAISQGKIRHLPWSSRLYCDNGIRSIFLTLDRSRWTQRSIWRRCLEKRCASRMLE